ncbi:Uncharacterised protein [Burkholderia pseudomallei]|nr:Uncharacterised protein [Burkholderia pseudomallei]CAJ3565811.1 Uncharacterised protein [Burkholderia pseudomallei]CAJ3757415.1 Uncharacterised protein [Burkholderia pseudomallei]CAJ3813193.1 Uncharacterised protein [Burkholderia pseudomallei]CAJ3980790.1 Uncharacterised protein [Burkholderia pseudomallei]
MRRCKMVLLLQVLTLVGASARAEPPIQQCRYKTVPPGYIVSNYVSNFSLCPNPPGYTTVYTVAVLERYDNQPIGATLTMCDGQTLPAGWMVLSRPLSPLLCPREPGDMTPYPSYSLISRCPVGKPCRASQSP